MSRALHSARLIATYSSHHQHISFRNGDGKQKIVKNSEGQSQSSWHHHQQVQGWNLGTRQVVAQPKLTRLATWTLWSATQKEAEGKELAVGGSSETGKGLIRLICPSNMYGLSVSKDKMRKVHNEENTEYKSSSSWPRFKGAHKSSPKKVINEREVLRMKSRERAQAAAVFEENH